MTSAPALSQNTTTRRHGFFSRADATASNESKRPPRRSRVSRPRRCATRLRASAKVSREARGVQDRAAGLVVRDRGRVRDALHGGGGAGVEQLPARQTLQRGSPWRRLFCADVFSRRPSLAGARFQSRQLSLVWGPRSSLPVTDGKIVS